MPARAVLIYLCALVPLACGIGLLWQRAAASSARVLLAFLLLWLLLLRIAHMFVSLTVDVWYSSLGQTAVIVAGAWVLYAWFAADGDRRRLGFAAGDKGVRIARVLYGLALIPFGLSHFVYLEVTAPLVPAWLPAHVAGRISPAAPSSRRARSAHRRVCAAGGRALGVADRPVHAAGVGADPGGGPQRLPVG